MFYVIQNIGLKGWPLIYTNILSSIKMYVMNVYDVVIVLSEKTEILFLES